MQSLRPIKVYANEAAHDLWSRTLLIATHARSTTTAPMVLVEALRRYRRALSRRHGPGWLESIEAQYYKPKPRKITTKGPPPKPSTYVD